MLDSADQALPDLARLSDPVRRRLYLHVLRSPEPVSRDGAANALEIARSLAAFHLDRLVEAGLLDVEYRRLGGRSGPGAGRPSKLYRASSKRLQATLPERRFQVAAELFAAALSQGKSRRLGTLNDEALQYGRTLGEEARRRAGNRPTAKSRFDALESILRDAGYVPFQDEDFLRLRNCPFHEIAQRYRELTCGMNLALLEGLLEGAGMPDATAHLDPGPGRCCVAISQS